MRVSKGDRHAFAALYQSAAPKLFGVALRISRERGLAEDVLQETFVHVWREAGRFETARGSAMAWMIAITRNRAIDALRRRGRRTEGHESPDDALLAMADPAAATDGGVEVMALARCMDTLDDRAQELVLLAYFEGWTREELAAMTGSPVNTVKTWLRRALQRLKACLEGDGSG
ncbi:MAG: sigma-70 family RNA polymerase sigma factor [Pseudomonadota bacterium]